MNLFGLNLDFEFDNVDWLNRKSCIFLAYHYHKESNHGDDDDNNNIIISGWIFVVVAVVVDIQYRLPIPRKMNACAGPKIDILQCKNHLHFTANAPSSWPYLTIPVAPNELCPQYWTKLEYTAILPILRRNAFQTENIKEIGRAKFEIKNYKTEEMKHFLWKIHVLVDNIAYF